MTKFSDLKTKKARIQFIREKLGSDVNWAIRGMLRIFERQTADEQAAGDTRYHNKVGFSGVDAEILTSYSQQVNKGRTMTGPQMAIIFKKMPKYAKQLESISK